MAPPQSCEKKAYTLVVNNAKSRFSPQKTKNTMTYGVGNSLRSCIGTETKKWQG